MNPIGAFLTDLIDSLETKHQPKSLSLSIKVDPDFPFFTDNKLNQTIHLRSSHSTEFTTISYIPYLLDRCSIITSRNEPDLFINVIHDDEEIKIQTKRFPKNHFFAQLIFYYNNEPLAQDCITLIYYRDSIYYPLNFTFIPSTSEIITDNSETHDVVENKYLFSFEDSQKKRVQKIDEKYFVYKKQLKIEVYSYSKSKILSLINKYTDSDYRHLRFGYEYCDYEKKHNEWFLIPNKYKKRIKGIPSFIGSTIWITSEGKKYYILIVNRETVVGLYTLYIAVSHDFSEHTSLAYSLGQTRIFSSNSGKLILSYVYLDDDFNMEYCDSRFTTQPDLDDSHSGTKTFVLSSLNSVEIIENTQLENFVYFNEDEKPTCYLQTVDDILPVRINFNHTKTWFLCSLFI